MLDPKLRERLAFGYAKLGDLGYKIALGLHKGKDNSLRQKELWNQAIKLRYILNILFRHVTFEEGTNKPVLWNITEEQVNKFVKYLLIIGDYENYPVVPTIIPTTKPWILNKGAKGDQGIQGNPGQDTTNIVVRPKAGENEVQVTTVIDLDGTKAYELEFSLYTPQLLTAVFQGTKVFELGNVVESINYLITSTKGTASLTALTIIDDADANTELQGLVSLVILNGVVQPVQYTVVMENISSNKTLTTTSNDGTTTKSASDSISFVKPFLSGASDVEIDDIINYYTSLQKTLTGKSNILVNFNGLNQYHLVMYPEEYGALSQLKDDNGFNIIDSFETGVKGVITSGLDNNYGSNYRYYITRIKTDIDNRLYQLIF